ncbi:MAG TPA: DUF2251 domain-containing protein [Pyrinomonadaceae bacterium]
MSNFIVDKSGPNGLVGVFEDDGDTGYFYLYDVGGETILGDLQIYNDAKALKFDEHDVEVVWSSDEQKCGVRILNGMRGIIDVKGNMKVNSKLESRDSVPITDPYWLEGFK